jgi:hypothetical protein
MEQLRKSIDCLNLGSRFHVQLETLTREGLERAIKRMFEQRRKHADCITSQGAKETAKEQFKTPLDDNDEINHSYRNERAGPIQNRAFSMNDIESCYRTNLKRNQAKK